MKDISVSEISHKSIKSSFFFPGSIAPLIDPFPFIVVLILELQP